MYITQYTNLGKKFGNSDSFSNQECTIGDHLPVKYWSSNHLKTNNEIRDTCFLEFNYFLTFSRRVSCYCVVGYTSLLKTCGTEDITVLCGTEDITMYVVLETSLCMWYWRHHCVCGTEDITVYVVLKRQNKIIVYF